MYLQLNRLIWFISKLKLSNLQIKTGVCNMVLYVLLQLKQVCSRPLNLEQVTKYKTELKPRHDKPIQLVNYPDCRNLTR